MTKKGNFVSWADFSRVEFNGAVVVASKEGDGT